MEFEPWFTVLGLVASIASLVLAIVAILLSVKFFQLSKDQSDKSEQASRDIAGAVTRLESLFDRMYSDTFGMVRNMQDRIWQMVEIPVVKTDALPSEEEAQPKKEQGVPASPSHTRVALEPSENAEQEAAQERVLGLLREAAEHGVQRIRLDDLIRQSKRRFGRSDVGVLFSLRMAGEISWDGPEGELHDRNFIFLTPFVD